MKSMIEGSNVLKPDFGWYNEPQHVENEELPCDKKLERRAGKKRGQKSEVYAYELEDLGKILHYFVDNGMWIHYLLLAIQSNSARRVGDLIGYRDIETGERVSNGLLWNDFFDPSTGLFRRDIQSFCEQKTGKIASPVINEAMRSAILLYCENTHCDPALNNYREPVFKQLSGTYKGRVLSYDGALKALKKVQKQLDLEYNVGTHSARKTFGAVSLATHPGDAVCMQTIRAVYGHSSEAVTGRYVGLEEKKTRKLADDFGEVFTKYGVNQEQVPLNLASPVIYVDTEALFQLIQQAFYAGKNSDGSNDAALVIELTKQINNIRK